MPKLEGRNDARPRITELTTEYVIDYFGQVWHEWERPASCSVIDCGVRPDLMDRYGVAVRESELQQVSAGNLPLQQLQTFILCDSHVQFLTALHDERPGVDAGPTGES